MVEYEGRRNPPADPVGYRTCLTWRGQSMRERVLTQLVGVRLAPALVSWIDVRASERAMSRSEFVRLLLVSVRDAEGRESSTASGSSQEKPP